MSIDQLSWDIFKMVLQDETLAPEHQISAPVAMTIQNAVSIDQLSRDISKMALQNETLALEHQISTPAATTIHNAAPSLRSNSSLDETFAVLAMQDHELHERTKKISILVEGLDAREMEKIVLKKLEEEKLWLAEQSKKIAHLDTTGNEASELLYNELAKSMDNVSAAVESIKRTLEAQTPEDDDQKSQAAEIVHTGEMPSAVVSLIFICWQNGNLTMASITQTQLSFCPCSLHSF